jgi:hypothetical protein
MKLPVYQDHGGKGIMGSYSVHHFLHAERQKDRQRFSISCTVWCGGIHIR